jgi:peptidoglycan/LPS O-acetylase OafA/YrhL
MTEEQAAPATEPALAPPPPRPRPHLRFLEGIRALAALMVYANHAYAQAWNPLLNRYPTGLFKVFSYTLVTGHFAVTVFIALSGFCLALPAVSTGGALRDGVKGFLTKRARRILPPYYAALGLCLLLIYTIIGKPSGSLWDVPIIVDAQAITSHVLLVQNFFRTGRINYVFWSIAVEWQIYFLFPPLLWLARRRGMLLTTAFFLVLGYALAFPLVDTRFGRANPHFIGVFALGVLAAFIAYSEQETFARWRRFQHYGTVAAAILALTLSSVAFLGLGVTKTMNALLDLGIGLFTFFLLIGCATQARGKVTRLLSLPPLAKLGTFSYSFYLVHAPLLQILWLYGTEPIGLSFQQTFVVLMTLGLALVLLASYGFFWMFERPFLSSGAKTRVS